MGREGLEKIQVRRLASLICQVHLHVRARNALGERFREATQERRKHRFKVAVLLGVGRELARFKLASFPTSVEGVIEKHLVREDAVHKVAQFAGHGRDTRAPRHMSLGLQPTNPPLLTPT